MVAAKSPAARRPSVRPRKPSHDVAAGPQAPAHNPLFNDSAQKALAVLEAFGRGRRVLKLAEAAEVAGITKASAQRCIHTLEVLGYLRRDRRSTGWVLTPRALGIAHAYLSGYHLIEQATQHLVDLNRATGESVSLSEPDGTDMVFVARFPSHKRFLIHMPIGRRLPMYCTASGRAYLSALPAAQAQRMLRQSSLRALTPATITDPRRIMELIEAAHADGYACSDQECYRGDVTVAAPVIGEGGHPVAAINISAPTSRWTLEEMRAKLAPLVMETARAVSSGAVPQARG
ncbi:MAG: helix-turn-helix domain-containing protein [Gammaproteobacteria bacterium]|nr:helix-turn-helix domain-containing protein [Gammaproteobacteria bacterium]MDE2261780.1 helix-turn-helix domain-containing protein [Gammaproteobacteria bacterium]